MNNLHLSILLQRVFDYQKQMIDESSDDRLDELAVDYHFAMLDLVREFYNHDQMRGLAAEWDIL